MKYRYTAEEKVVIWLDSFEGLTFRQKEKILELVSDPTDLVRDFEAYAQTIAEIASQEICASIKNTLKDGEYLGKVLGELEKKDIFAVTYRSADYPVLLKIMSARPLILYGKGERKLLQEKKIAIVGSRKTLPWAAKLAESAAAEICKHFVVVTGLAEGGDLAAVKGVLGASEKEANLICVLAHGLDHVYPAAHADWKEKVAKRGLLLSEYPPKVAPQKFLFPVRNRIIAGLCQGVLVVSAGARSGTTITANYAVDYGRDVFAFPYNPGIESGEGCNSLIRMGAILASRGQDVLSEYGILPPKQSNEAPMPEWSAEERPIMEYLTEKGEAHIEEIAKATNMPTYLLSGVLSGLEVKGYVARLGGNRYAIVNK